jgi:hypothetical protein
LSVRFLQLNSFLTTSWYQLLKENIDLKSTLLNHFIAKPEIHWSKLKECIPFALTSTFISIILENGANPDFLEKNDYTNDIKNFLNENAKENDPKKKPTFSEIATYMNYFFLQFRVL